MGKKITCGCFGSAGFDSRRISIILGGLILMVGLVSAIYGYYIPRLDIYINQAPENTALKYAGAYTVMDQYCTALLTDNQSSLTQLTAGAEAQSREFRLSYNEKEKLRYSINNSTAQLPLIPTTITASDGTVIGRFAIFTIGSHPILRADACKYRLRTLIAPDNEGKWQIKQTRWVRIDNDWSAVNNMRADHSTAIFWDYLQTIETDKSFDRLEITRQLSNINEALAEKIGPEPQPTTYPGTFGVNAGSSCANTNGITQTIEHLKLTTSSANSDLTTNYIVALLGRTCNWQSVEIDHIYTNYTFAAVMPQGVTRNDGLELVPGLFFLAGPNNTWQLTDYCWLDTASQRTFIEGFITNYPDITALPGDGLAMGRLPAKLTYADLIGTWQMTELIGPGSAALKQTTVNFKNETLIFVESYTENSFETSIWNYKLENNRLEITSDNLEGKMTGFLDKGTLEIIDPTLNRKIIFQKEGQIVSLPESMLGTWQMTECSGKAADNLLNCILNFKSGNQILVDLYLSQGTNSLICKYNLKDKLITIKEQDNNQLFTGFIDGESMTLVAPEIKISLTKSDRTQTLPDNLLGKWQTTNLIGNNTTGYEWASLNFKPNNVVLVESVQNGEYYSTEAKFTYNTESGKIRLFNNSGENYWLYMEDESIELFITEQNLKLIFEKGSEEPTTPLPNIRPTTTPPSEIAQ